MTPELLLTGKSIKEIAIDAGINHRTAYWQAKMIFSLYNVQTREQFMSLFIDQEETCTF